MVEESGEEIAPAQSENGDHDRKRSAVDADTSPVHGDLEATLALLRRAQSGERSAVDALFERFAPRVRLIAALRFGWTLQAFDDHEDIAQEALLRAFKGLSGFQPVDGDAIASIGKLRNWLSCCVQTAILDRQRRAQAGKRGEGKALRFADIRRESYTSSVFVGAGREPTPSQAAQAKDSERLLEAALLAIPERPREVFILRRLCGMDYPEIRAKLGYETDGAVRLVVYHVQKKIEEALRASGPW